MENNSNEIERPAYKVKSNITKPLSGIPLGGIGTGTIELRPDGHLHDWQIMNNPPWSGGGSEFGGNDKDSDVIKPYQNFFAVRTQIGEEIPVIRILGSRELESIDDLYHRPNFRNTTAFSFVGEFPFAYMNYDIPQMPIEIKLEAFSPFIPLDAKNSALPAIFFRFHLKNKVDAPVKVSLAAGFPNPSGYKTFNKSIVHKHETSSQGYSAMVMSAEGNIPITDSSQNGQLCFSILGDNISYNSYVEQGNNASFGEQARWTDWFEKGELPNSEGRPRSQALDTEVTKKLDPLIQLGMSYNAPGASYSRFREIEMKYLTDHDAMVQMEKEDKRMLIESDYRWIVFLEEYLRQNQPDQWNEYQERITESDKCDEEERTGLLEELVKIPIANDTNRPIRPPIMSAELNRMIELPANEETILELVLVWYYPNHRYHGTNDFLGHMYANWFQSALDVLNYVVDNNDMLYEKTKEFKNAMYNTTLPYWVVDAINAQLVCFIKESFWTKAGDFGIWEGLGCCGLETLDVTAYGSIAVSMLFPELEFKQIGESAKFQLTPENPRYHEYMLAFPKNLKVWKELVGTDPEIIKDKTKLQQAYETMFELTGQKADGRMPHFFPGTFSFVDAYHMVDLQPKFALLVYRDYLYSGNTAFMEEMWPHIKLAMEHNLMMGKEHDYANPYMLEREVSRSNISAQTYDGWHFLGISIYVSALWLAALRACQKMAELMNEPDYASKMQEIYDKALEECESLLWNGEYYKLWVDPPKEREDQNCMADGLMGQWFANLCQLGHILPDDHINQMLESIFKYNRQFEMGLMNGFLPAERAHGNEFKHPAGQRETPWSGTEYEVAALFIQEGKVEQGLQIMKDVYDRYEETNLTWNHIECGQHYYRCMVALSILMELAGFYYNAPDQSLVFTPRNTPDKYQSIFTTPLGWGMISQQREGDSVQIKIEGKEGKLTLKMIALQAQLGDNINSLTVDGNPIQFAKEIQNEKIILTLESAIELMAGTVVTIE